MRLLSPKEINKIEDVENKKLNTKIVEYEKLLAKVEKDIEKVKHQTDIEINKAKQDFITFLDKINIQKSELISEINELEKKRKDLLDNLTNIQSEVKLAEKQLIILNDKLKTKHDDLDLK